MSFWGTARAFLLVGGLFGGGLLAGSATSLSAWGKGRSPYEGLDTLARVLTNIELYYVDDVETDTLLRDAIRGMVSHLDAHTLYLDPEAWRGLQDRNADPVASLGLALEPAEGGLRVATVDPGGPADRAGVRAGDQLIRVNDAEISALQVDDVGQLLEGSAGGQVSLSLLRGGSTVDVTLVRDAVIRAAVNGALFSPGLAYVSVSQFRHRVSQELGRALDRLATEGGQPLRGLVIDLRDNPGGMLEEAMAVTDRFLRAGAIVSTRGRSPSDNFSLKASADPTDIDIPLVLLINGGSASASEIVAGALRDHARAKLVGTHTYGKGSVQSVYEFEDGSALKLTVARYYLPKGEPIEDGVGVVPDIVVEQEEAPSTSGTLAERMKLDPQLAAAYKLLAEESGEGPPP